MMHSCGRIDNEVMLLYHQHWRFFQDISFKKTDATQDNKKSDE